MQTSGLRTMVFVGLVLAVGCADPDRAGGADRDTDLAVVLPEDASACGATCGDGPLFAVDSLDFVQPIDGQVAGFDLDDDEGAGDCGVADLDSPDGVPGVDNQFGSVMSTLPSTVEAVLPDAIAYAILTGNMTVLVEVVGVADLSQDAQAAVAVRLGSGAPIVHGEQIAPGQTFGLDADPLLGFAAQASVSDGVVLAGPFDMDLRLDFLGTPVAFTLRRTRLRMEASADGSATGVIGGVISLTDVQGILSLLGGDDTELRNLLEALVPNLVDARTTPEGDCDGISAALELTAIPAFITDEVVASGGSGADTDGA